MREYCYALLLLMKGGAGLLMLQHAPYSSISSPPTIPSLRALQQQSKSKRCMGTLWYAYLPMMHGQLWEGRVEVNGVKYACKRMVSMVGINAKRETNMTCRCRER